MKEYGFEPYYPEKASNMKKPLGNFEEIIDDSFTSQDKERVRKVIICTGKIYYDLIEAR